VSSGHLVDAIEWIVSGDLPGSPALVKSQTVRVIDVLAWGPLALWAGLRVRRDGGLAFLAGWVLALLGLATIWFNALNWHRINQLSQTRDSPRTHSDTR